MRRKTQLRVCCVFRKTPLRMNDCADLFVLFCALCKALGQFCRVIWKPTAILIVIHANKSSFPIRRRVYESLPAEQQEGNERFCVLWLELPWNFTEPSRNCESDFPQLSDATKCSSSLFAMNNLISFEHCCDSSMKLDTFNIHTFRLNAPHLPQKYLKF
jgi:hypothetical protein